jgi:hypothetical protein
MMQIRPLVKVILVGIYGHTNKPLKYFRDEGGNEWDFNLNMMLFFRPILH